MLKDITLGQYYPANSVIHKLDPRVKIVLTFFMIILLFTIKGVYAYTLTALFVFIVIALSRVPVYFIIKGVKPVILILIITGLLNIFMTKGTVVFQIFGLCASKEGIYYALLMMVRLILLLFLTSLLTLTTSPIMLTNGIEKLIAPLKKVKVPVHELAMMMTIALRFIPTLLEETDKIIKAQSSRGADFTSGGMLKRAKAIIPILIPLFVSAFRRADELAVAMECRCYRGGEGRTSLKVFKLEIRDYCAFGISFLFGILTYLVSYVR